MRVDFADGTSIEFTPKPTPWDEFDYWFVTYGAERDPTALVALDAGGGVLAHEDVSGMPDPRDTPTPVTTP
ncbi:MAG: hypothetical protein ACRDKG_16705 [Actinomycetota bacterium]